MTKEFLMKGCTSSVAAGALGYVLTSQITNISLDVGVCGFKRGSCRQQVNLARRKPIFPRYRQQYV